MNLAALYRAVGKLPAAKPLYEKAIAIQEEALGPDSPELGETLNNLAGCMNLKIDFEMLSPFTASRWRLPRRHSGLFIRMSRLL